VVTVSVILKPVELIVFTLWAGIFRFEMTKKTALKLNKLNSCSTILHTEPRDSTDAWQVPSDAQRLRTDWVRYGINPTGLGTLLS
jgi:hypothetical protein